MGNDEIKELVRVQQEVHRTWLNLRAFDRLVQSFEFEDAFLASKDRSGLDEILKSHSIPRLKSWIGKQIVDPLEAMSYRQLRDLCKKRNVARWSRLSRDEMVEELRGVLVQSSQEPSGRSATVPDSSGDSAGKVSDANRGHQSDQTGEVSEGVRLAGVSNPIAGVRGSPESMETSPA